ncbi:MAG: hypothetical protein ACI8R4_002751 [Paracoccaceae bacterium]|jgi:hypothetical protein
MNGIDDMTSKPNWMVSRADLAAQRPLDTQSRGRPLTEAERGFATALEQVFAQGIHDMSKVAEALAADQVPAPISGGTNWDGRKLAEELSALNASLDAAFEEHGYGA